AVDVSGWAEATIDPYLYRFTIVHRPDKEPREALAALDDEIKRMQDKPAPTAEIQRAVKQARAVFAYGSENITHQAFWMGYTSMFSDYGWYTTYLKKLAKVTPGDVQRVAREYFQPKKRVVGVYLPKGKAA
ncbi:MAG: insulinase family protein, partial [Anaerolineales bacterium]|nr:insulinase family protein [Anaerolineales bacterium]